MSVNQLPSGPEKVVVEATFPLVTPGRLFDYWTQPPLIQSWWPPQAEIEAREGGTYHLSWPRMNWHLRGHYTSFEPGKQLAFTWGWDDNPQDPGTREVSMLFEPLADSGTRLVLTHGPYAETPEDQAIRLEQHLVGWQHFLGCLKEVASEP